MNVNMPILRIVYCLMEVHFLSLGSKRRPWEVPPSDREQVAVPVMAPDIVTEVQGKNYTNPEGFTMSILYCWKRLEVYFPMALNSSTFDNPAMRFEYFVKDYSRTAPDFVTEVQGKNCTNPEGFTMGILYRWKCHEVYFPMASISSTLDIPAMRFEYFCKDCSRTE